MVNMAKKEDFHESAIDLDSDVFAMEQMACPKEPNDE
jgi:hypothetical protein